TVDTQNIVGITAGGNLAKGKGDGQSVTHTNSHVGTAGSTTNINASAVNIAGGQIKGATTINADTLNISSLQDTSTYKSKQQSGGGQVTVGLSGSVDVQANYSQSKIKANYASVGEQSGIFSGDDGYNININDKTTLNGAVISSSQKAVDEGKANFKTSSLQTSDIQNHADYSADGFGISASVSNSNHGNQDAPKELGTSKTIGYGSDSDTQATTTKSGIITSDKESDYAGKLANNFDKNEVQNELDTSVRVTQAFDATRQSVKQEINKEIDEANKNKKDAEDKAKNPNLTYEEAKNLQADINKANEKIAEMQEVGLLVDMVNGALYNPSDTLAGTAVNTLSPKIVYEIGQHFKEEKTEGSPRHILAQALVAGVTAGLAGNDALTSALSAGGAEALAPKLASVLYGIDENDVSKMTAEQKQTISAIISLAGTAVGATSGSVTDMVASGVAGTVAVEENSLAEFLDTIERVPKDLAMLRDERVKALKAKNYKLAEELNEEIKKDLALLKKIGELGKTPAEQINNLSKFLTKVDNDGITIAEVFAGVSVEETARLITKGEISAVAVELLLNSVKTPKVIKDKIQKAISYTKQYKIEFDPNVISANGLGGIKIVKKKEIEAGKGEYKNVAGHHLHAKAGFVDSTTYDPQKGFSISDKFMDENGLKHDKMTTYQRQAFKELFESGRPNTMAEHTRIAVEALEAGGASREMARSLVAESLNKMRNDGIKVPTNMPWYDKKYKERLKNGR
ncbi:MAG: hypothetical protein FNT15_09715, partial [Sulfurovum sp.]